jgi:hypothetical protein
MTCTAGSSQQGRNRKPGPCPCRCCAGQRFRVRAAAAAAAEAAAAAQGHFYRYLPVLPLLPLPPRRATHRVESLMKRLRVIEEIRSSNFEPFEVSNRSKVSHSAD